MTEDNEKKDKGENDFTSAFNGSLDTLDRIGTLLKLCSDYCVNDNIRGYKRNLWELLKESQGFLKSEEIKTARKIWIGDKDKKRKGIKDYDISYDEDNDKYSYDKELFDLLEKFDFWIRLKLHRQQVTMAKRRDMIDKMVGLKNRYGIN